MERPGEGCHVAGCYVFLISAIHLSAASVLLLGNTTRCPCYCNCQRVLKQIISRKSDKHIPSPTRVDKTAMPKLRPGNATSRRKWEGEKSRRCEGQPGRGRGSAGGSFSQPPECHVQEEILRGMTRAEHGVAPAAGVLAGTGQEGWR